MADHFQSGLILHFCGAVSWVQITVERNSQHQLQDFTCRMLGFVAIFPQPSKCTNGFSSRVLSHMWKVHDRVAKGMCRINLPGESFHQTCLWLRLGAIWHKRSAVSWVNRLFLGQCLWDHFSHGCELKNCPTWSANLYFQTCWKNPMFWCRSFWLPAIFESSRKLIDVILYFSKVV